MSYSPSENEKRISPDRKRTNLLRGLEQPVIAFLCRIMPAFVTPNMLTFLGLVASCFVCYGFFLARNNPHYLAVCIIAFAFQWLGDSLDGRIAYYRNIPRKWYGFALDLSMDWIATVLIGVGFYFYLAAELKVIAIIFIAAYAWTMLLTILKFKLIDKYEVDSGIVGPTELRIGICAVLFIGIFYPQIITAFALVVIGVVMIVNLVEFRKVLRYGDARDKSEQGK